MSIRLVRESSESPNITNRDDARMVRYAYNGMNGVVKSFGNELSYNASGGKFTIGTGRIVLQGWEVDIEGSAWELDVSSVTSGRRYVIYLEVNVAAEIAEIKASYLIGSAFPEIDPGDDLTAYPDGIARLPLYQFVVSNGGSYSLLEKLVPTIPYAADKFSDIESRLEKLGFKEGSVVPPSGTSDVTISVNNNFLKRQGNYVIGRLTYNITAKYIGISGLITNLLNFGLIPFSFLPTTDTVIKITVTGTNAKIVEAPDWSSSAIEVRIAGGYLVDAIISASDGTISLNGNAPDNAAGVLFSPNKVDITFGYEARPLT